jgi:hypothetical protein
MQAQKAMGKSNRVMGGSIMIGVSACSDPGVIEDNYIYNNTSILSQSHAGARVAAAASTPLHYSHNHSVAGGFADQSVTTLNSSLGGSHLNKSSIRPLAQAYKAANTDHDVSYLYQSLDNFSRQNRKDCRKELWRPRQLYLRHLSLTPDDNILCTLL